MPTEPRSKKRVLRLIKSLYSLLLLLQFLGDKKAVASMAGAQ